MKVYLTINEHSRDEYDRPFSITADDPRGGTYTLADIRYGCEEAKDVHDLRAFAQQLVDAWNKEHGS